jgi:hypothetical protein
MNHHYFSNNDMAWDWKPVLNNNPYTFIEWGILSLYGIFLYKLTNMVMGVNRSVIDKDIDEIDTSVIDKDIEEIDTSVIDKDIEEKDRSKTQKPRCIVIVKRYIKSASTDKELRKKIATHLKEKGFATPYFLSTFNDPDYHKLQHQSRIAHETLNTFLIKLYKTNHSLVLMNSNDFEWEYEPYITLGQMNNIYVEMAYA